MNEVFQGLEPDEGLAAHLRQAPDLQLEAGTDARAERYWQLLAVIKGWPPFPAHVPAFEWLIAALRAHS